MIKRVLSLPDDYSFFLLGPRQTGKSTLLRQLFDPAHTRYYDLLLSKEFQRFVSNPDIFTQEVMGRPKKITHIVVDEIQRIPQLLNEIHAMLEGPNPPVFCLSGSSARKLKRQQANLLAGRAIIYHLFPLTHQELGKQFSLEKVLSLGSLPKVYFAKSHGLASRILQTYVDTYLEQEIKQEALVRNIGGFIRFLNLAADANGYVINYSTIARECGVSYKVVQEYFQILEDTLVGFFLLPYAKSIRKRLIKHPKFYFFDTGVVRALKKQLSVPLLPKTYDYGRAFEHFVIAEIYRLAQYNNKDYQFSFYQTANQAEVDLIVETPQKNVFAIEIKSSSAPEKEAMGGLSSFKEICPQAKLLCVSNVPHRRNIGEITILPWLEVFKEIGI